MTQNNRKLLSLSENRGTPEEEKKVVSFWFPFASKNVALRWIEDSSSRTPLNAALRAVPQKAQQLARLCIQRADELQVEARRWRCVWLKMGGASFGVGAPSVGVV